MREAFFFFEQKVAKDAKRIFLQEETERTEGEWPRRGTKMHEKEAGRQF